MKRLVALSFVPLLWVSGAWGQNVIEVNPQPYNSGFGPEYTVMKAEFSYPQAISSLADINVRITSCIPSTQKALTGFVANSITGIGRGIRRPGHST
jgi:hypothetical protein